ncbi:phosphotransferase family protein [Actinomadura geliboluensis]|uniref:phosphotransferase family protein n=1 Tax=Actinomadura geliboluensis TaxID=882440 RepID=UPI003710CED7
MGTGALPGIDAGALTGWFGEALGAPGPLAFTLIAGGRSNLTYRVDAPDGRAFALRRPPTGDLLPTAHDMEREWRIVTALGRSAVPVPRTRGLCADPAVTGAPFYVMDFVDGTVLDSDAAAAGLPPEARDRFSRQCAEVLAAIHEVAPADAGLTVRPGAEPYVPRQLRRWTAQVERVAARTGGDDPAARDLAEVRGLLAARTPPQRWTGVAHGDFRPGNLIVRPDGTVAAVLDWELCTTGDVLADLGWLTAWWHTGDTVGWGPSRLPGFLDRDALARCYAETTGRDVSDLPFFEAFALWRLGCIGHGVHDRYRGGAMDAPAEPLEALERRPRELAAIARDILLGRA